MAFSADEYIEVIVDQIRCNFQQLEKTIKICPKLQEAIEEYQKSKTEKTKNEISLYRQSIGDIACDGYRSIEPLTVGLFGEWGSGKTHLLKLIKYKISQTDTFPAVTIPIFFNAWRFEKEEHIIIPLFQTMLAQLESYPYFGLGENVKRTLRRAGQKFRILLYSLKKGLKIPSDIKSTVDSLMRHDISVLFDFIDTDKVKEEYKKEIENHDYKKLLTDTLNSSRIESLYLHIPQWIEKIALFDKINFVFLIDDLDRCLPENTLKMLESIKLFLDVPSCAFVLALDDDVVERGVAYHYRDFRYHFKNSDTKEMPITGHEYLEKMIHLPFRIPFIDSDNVKKFLEENYSDFFQKIDKSGELIDFFAKTIPPKPRKIKRTMMLFETKLKVLEKLNLPIDYKLSAKITLLELFAPKLLRFIQNNGYRRIFDRLADFRNADDKKEFKSRSLADTKLIKEWIEKNTDQKEKNLYLRVMEIVEENYNGRMIFELDDIFDIKIEAKLLKDIIELKTLPTKEERKTEVKILSSSFMKKLFKPNDSTSWRDAFDDNELFAEGKAFLSDKQLNEIINKAKEKEEFGGDPEWVGVVASHTNDKQYIKMLKELYHLRFANVEGKFEMGKYQVTFSEYDRYCEIEGIKKPDDKGWGRDKRPVIYVSWEDATKYAKWLTDILKHKYRLPEEKEWELAYGGDKDKKWYFGDDESKLKEYAWYRNNSGGKTHPVGQLKPNHGLYDMSGNVWEWCEDWYDKREKEKVLRGGSWLNSASNSRSSNRSWGNPIGRVYNMGFRLLRTLPS